MYLLSIAVSLNMRKEKRKTDGDAVVRDVRGCSRVGRHLTKWHMKMAAVKQ